MSVPMPVWLAASKLDSEEEEEKIPHTGDKASLDRCG